MRPLLPLLVGLAACASGPGTPGPVVVAPTTDPSVRITPAVPAPRSFPIDGAALVPQVAEFGSVGPEMRRLPDGGLVVIRDGAAIVLDPSFRIRRRIPFEPYSGRPVVLGLDSLGRRLELKESRVLIDEGRSVRRGTSFIACDDAVTRCVSSESRTGGFALGVHSVPDDALLTSVPVEATRLRELVPDAGQPADPSTNSVAIVGDTLFVVFGGSPYRLCRIDVATQAVTACIVPPRYASVVHADAAHVSVGSSSAFATYDATTLAETGPTLDRVDIIGISRDATSLAIRAAGRLRFYDGITHEPMGEDVGVPGTFALGSDGRYATVVGADVRFFERGREVGTATLAPAPEPAEGQLAASRATMIARHVEDALDLIAPSRGVARVRAGDRDVGFVGARTLAGTIRLDSGHLPRIVGPAAVLSFGPDGLRAGSVTDEVDEDDVDDSSEPDIDEDFADADVGDAIGRAPAGIEGVDYAFLEGGALRITDRHRVDAVRPIRLPRPVAASECSEVTFVSDVSVALHGYPPCIPTLVDFRSRRTSPLGPAYVSVARTEDHRRTAMMSNRAVQILDGRTGAELVELSPDVPHPRDVRISADGRRAVLYGTDNFAVLDLSPLDADAPPTAASIRAQPFADAWPREYDLASDLVYGCEDGKFRVAHPFDLEHVRSIDVPACAAGYALVDEGAGPVATRVRTVSPNWTKTDGYLIGTSPTGIASIVRTRDLAVLSFRGFGSIDENAFALVDGDATTGGERVLGVYPDDSSLVMFRDPASGEPFAVVPSAEDVDRRVREFFAAP